MDAEEAEAIAIAVAVMAEAADPEAATAVMVAAMEAGTAEGSTRTECSTQKAQGRSDAALFVGSFMGDE